MVWANVNTLHTSLLSRVPFVLRNSARVVREDSGFGNALASAGCGSPVPLEGVQEAGQPSRCGVNTGSKQTYLSSQKQCAY